MLGKLIKNLKRAGRKVSHRDAARAFSQSGDWVSALDEYHMHALGGDVDHLALKEAAQLALVKGQSDLGRFFLERAAAADPSDYAILANLSVLKKGVGDIEGALGSALESVKLAGKRAEPLYNLALICHEIGEFSDAEKYYRQALENDPTFEPAYDGLIGLLDHVPDISIGSRALVCELWARRYPFRPESITYRNIADPERILNIGYVSADFRGHSSAYFIEPLLKRHDARQVKVYCYSNSRNADEVTNRIRSLSVVWRDIWRWDDLRVAKQIAEDAIDVLIDLSGHTVGHRLGVFALQPAPIQATYMGYLGSTGLRQIRYRLSDEFLDPPGMTESAQIELIERIRGCCVSFEPERCAPALNALPALKNGFLTFGSLNARPKLNTAVLELWRRVLLAVEGSHLIVVVQYGESPRVSWPIIEFFGQRGVEASRVSVRGRQSLDGFFTTLQECDVTLDPFPYNGGTTTFHSLWMGVPVISLVGQSALSRCGSMILENIGLPDFIARTKDEYVSIAEHCALNLHALSELRMTMRDKFLNAPFSNSRRVAYEFESSIRRLWKCWCKKAPITNREGS